eukprot:scaffold8624_cov110-Isochrysis_galbana.AAC.11
MSRLNFPPQPTSGPPSRHHPAQWAISVPEVVDAAVGGEKHRVVPPGRHLAHLGREDAVRPSHPLWEAHGRALHQPVTQMAKEAAISD